MRIFVNKEITELINGLVSAAKILKKDGILAVVTFHSIEDKIVKYFFKSLSEEKSISRYVPKINQSDKLFKLTQKKPIIPSDKELSENVPSRSAKLRYVIKNDFYKLETDINQKFDHLIKLENIETNYEKILYDYFNFFLIFFTALIKNSTKKIDDEIFETKENLRGLKKELENIRLEHDY